MNNSFLAAIAAAILIAGCGSKNDANEKNFGTAISKYLEKKGDLCLGLTGKWPIDIPLNEKLDPFDKSKQMIALEAVGMVKAEDTEIDGNGYNGAFRGRKLRIKRYTLTDSSKLYHKDRENTYSSSKKEVKETLTDLCWGIKAFDKVVKWDGPMKFGDYQEAQVKYLYKIGNIADWAKKPEIMAAFPAVVKSLEDAGKKEQQHGVKLTSEGWEAKGLD